MNLTEAEITAMQTENARMKTQLLESQAIQTANAALGGNEYDGVPAAMKAVFAKSAIANLPMVEGKLDVVKITEAAQAAAKTYIESLPKTGMIEGNGDSGGDSITKLREGEIKKLMDGFKLTRQQAETAYYGR